MAISNEFLVKYGCLAFLTVQNTALILTLRYSRTQPGPQYLTSTAVLLSETSKCLLSLAIYTFMGWRRKEDSLDCRHSLTAISAAPSLLPRTQKDVLAILPLCIPAFLYTIQNNLQYIAISNLDAATYQVANQGKVLTTAACAIMLLKKRLKFTQVCSIILLTFGVASASVPSKDPTASSDFKRKDNHVTGLLAIAGSCAVSGFAGVYTEIIMKATQRKTSSSIDSSITFWHRNYQLALISAIFALPVVFIVDGERILKHGILYGYNPIVWITIFQQVVGGIAVALVITYADSILKTFATSLSVVLSTVVSIGLMDAQLAPTFFVGMVSVMIATPVYGIADRGGSRVGEEDEEAHLTGDQEEKEEDREMYLSSESDDGSSLRQNFFTEARRQ